jgi:predicted DNA repair protein MutK
MLGGAYLCFEGAEKVHELIFGHAEHEDEAKAPRTPEEVLQQERRRVSSAVRTDLILSAEIMAITLASVAESGFWTRVFVLAVVGICITALVYGVVAMIVKADDVGLALSRSGRRSIAALGRAIVRVMPGLLNGLSLLGTAAMLWVGGGIVLHGLEQFGWALPAELVHGLASGAAHSLQALGGVIETGVGAASAGVFGLALGSLVVFAAGLVPHAGRAS